MSRFLTGHTFKYNEQTTPEKLNAAVNDAEFGPDAVDGTSIDVTIGKKLEVADKGVTNDKLASLAVTTGKLGQQSVTAEKLGDQAVTSDKLKDGSVSTQKLRDASVTEEKLGFTIQGVPTGMTLLWFSPDNIPDGFLPLHGQILDIEDFRPLFNVIGYTWGGTSTTFNLPDTRGQAVRGFDSGKGVDPGRKFGTYQDDQLRRHNHSASASRSEIFGRAVTSISGGNKGNNYWAWDRIQNNPFFYAQPSSVQPTVTVGSTGGNETRMKNVTTTFVIKT